MKIFTLTWCWDHESSHPETDVQVFATREAIIKELKEEHSINLPKFHDEDTFYEWQRDESCPWRPVVLFDESGGETYNGLEYPDEQLFFEEHEIP